MCVCSTFDELMNNSSPVRGTVIHSPLYTGGAWVQLAGINGLAEMVSLGKDVIPDPCVPRATKLS